MSVGAFAIAWYRDEAHFRRMKAVSPDAADFFDTYEDWLESATEAARQAEKLGVPVVRVEVSVPEFLEWCSARGMPPNARARSRYAAEAARRADTGEPSE